MIGLELSILTGVRKSQKSIANKFSSDIFLKMKHKNVTC